MSRAPGRALRPPDRSAVRRGRAQLAARGVYQRGVALAVAGGRGRAGHAGPQAVFRLNGSNGPSLGAAGRALLFRPPAPRAAVRPRRAAAPAPAPAPQRCAADGCARSAVGASLQRRSRGSGGSRARRLCKPRPKADDAPWTRRGARRRSAPRQTSRGARRRSTPPAARRGCSGPPRDTRAQTTPGRTQSYV